MPRGAVLSLVDRDEYLTLADYRAYQPGDDFRRIDWSVYGRLGTLQVRLTEARERRERRLLSWFLCGHSAASPSGRKYAGFIGRFGREA